MQFKQTDGGRVEAGFAHEKNDCAVRAFAVLSGLGYKKAHELFKQAGRQDRKGTKLGVLEKVFASAGIAFDKVSTWYCGSVNLGSLQQVAKQKQTGCYILLSCNHAIALLDGTIHDTGIRNRARVKSIYKLTLPVSASTVTQTQVNELWERLNRLEQKL